MTFSRNGLVHRCLDHSWKTLIRRAGFAYAGQTGPDPRAPNWTTGRSENFRPDRRATSPHRLRLLPPLLRQSILGKRETFVGIEERNCLSRSMFLLVSRESARRNKGAEGFSRGNVKQTGNVHRVHRFSLYKNLGFKFLICASI